VTNYSVFCS